MSSKCWGQETVCNKRNTAIFGKSCLVETGSEGVRYQLQMVLIWLYWSRSTNKDYTRIFFSLDLKPYQQTQTLQRLDFFCKNIFSPGIVVLPQFYLLYIQQEKKTSSRSWEHSVAPGLFVVNLFWLKEVLIETLQGKCENYTLGFTFIIQFPQGAPTLPPPSSSVYSIRFRGAPLWLSAAAEQRTVAWWKRIGRCESVDGDATSWGRSIRCTDSTLKAEKSFKKLKKILLTGHFGEESWKKVVSVDDNLLLGCSLTSLCYSGVIKYFCFYFVYFNLYTHPGCNAGAFTPLY